MKYCYVTLNVNPETIFLLSSICKSYTRDLPNKIYLGTNMSLCKGETAYVQISTILILLIPKVRKSARSEGNEFSKQL